MRQMSEHEGSWAYMIVTYGLAFSGRASIAGAGAGVKRLL
jgi:hypothetical protein